MSNRRFLAGIAGWGKTTSLEVSASRPVPATHNDFEAATELPCRGRYLYRRHGDQSHRSKVFFSLSLRRTTEHETGESRFVPIRADSRRTMPCHAMPCHHGESQRLLDFDFDFNFEFDDS